MRGTYRNPILGIEVNLRKELQNAELSPTMKQKLLIDALEELAHSGCGFEKQLMHVVHFYRPEPSTTAKSEISSTVADLVRAQNINRDLERERYELETQIKNLQEEIEITKVQINDTKERIESTKEKILKKSDTFKSARELHEKLNDLLVQFDGIFEKKEDTQVYDQQTKAMIEDNTKKKKELERLKYELEIAKQITKRLQLQEKQRYV